MNTKKNVRKSTEIHFRCTEQDKAIIEKKAKNESISAFLLKRGLADTLCGNSEELIADWVAFENELSMLWHYVAQTRDEELKKMLLSMIRRVKKRNKDRVVSETR